MSSLRPELPEDESLFGSPVPESTLELPEHETLFGSPVPKPSLILPQCNEITSEESIDLTANLCPPIGSTPVNREKLKIPSRPPKSRKSSQSITATPTFKFEDLSLDKQMLVVSQLKRFIKEEQERRDKKRQETQQSSTDAYVAYQKACWEKAKLRAEAKSMTARKTNGPLPGSQPQIPGQLNMPQDSIVPPATTNNNEGRGAVGAFDWFEGLEPSKVPKVQY
ncbi:hypothetical protein FGSG_06601 [Fusarium graminearum PH-1]|uniref:hypothetical protein n=1 Tax=Gibberella zeae (strain ATCC MYA-4620 / CBS 123657 / FGSC 9075 / NRRL 31084 / PH-1) TaxID=229533 RepID=UPI00021F1373|nr:hypothetical protein FGSG_06601 [Fusarium graminearum PH-1]ESU12710.1 hypothetical protein FGSG_06601 [Fusarium graminearum PH-1]|eukprot:XP_011326217.1 hypothetical protein FGSG_06601 [Fusarium graminearum PH-1]